MINCKHITHLVDILMHFFHRICMTKCSETYEPICSLKTGLTYLNKCFYECFHDESEFEMEFLFGRNCRRISNNFKRICLKKHNKEVYVQFFKFKFYIFFNQIINSSMFSCIIDDSVQLFAMKEVRISFERLQDLCNEFNQSEKVEWMIPDNQITVCDTKGQEYFNVCTVQNITVSYLGKCRVCYFIQFNSELINLFQLFIGLLFNVWSGMWP